MDACFKKLSDKFQKCDAGREFVRDARRAIQFESPFVLRGESRTTEVG
jgi:hypothetical protein